MKGYEYKFGITTFDVDYNRNIRLSSMLRFMQEAGEEHLQGYNLSYEQILSKGVVFVVTSMTMEIYRMPRMYENISLKTLSDGIKGVRFLRSYYWYNDYGDTLAKAQGEFVLVDAATHTIARPQILSDDCPLFKPALSAHTSGKIIIPQNAELVGSEIIKCSQLDFNGHMNNTYYADFICDFIPESRNRTLKSFTISYVKEIKLGSRVDVYTAYEGTRCLLCGKVDDTICFKISCELG